MTQEKDEKEEKFRVSTKLSAQEKKYLKLLAEDNGRSMSSQLRFLLLEAVDESDN